MSDDATPRACVHIEVHEEDDDDDDEPSLKFVRAASAMVGLLTFPLWCGAAAVLWHWFVVPLGLPSLSLWQVGGIILLIGLVRFKNGQNRVHPRAWYYQAITEDILMPLLTFGVGFVLAWLGGFL